MTDFIYFCVQKKVYFLFIMLPCVKITCGGKSFCCVDKSVIE